MIHRYNKEWHPQTMPKERTGKQYSQAESAASSSSTSSSPSPRPPKNNRPSLKKIANRLLKERGLDAHSIKYEYLGKHAPVSRFDLAYDTKSGIIYIIKKLGKLLWKRITIFAPVYDEQEVTMAEFEVTPNGRITEEPDIQEYIPPCMHFAVVICFDEDVSFAKIDTTIGVNATNTLQYHLTRINPFTQRHNPGYWEYEMKVIRSESCSNLLDQIHSFLLQYGVGIKHVLNYYVTSKLIVRIFLDICQPNTFPDITIGKNLMKVIFSLGGSLDIVISEDFTTSN